MDCFGNSHGIALAWVDDIGYKRLLFTEMGLGWGWGWGVQPNHGPWQTNREWTKDQRCRGNVDSKRNGNGWKDNLNRIESSWDSESYHICWDSWSTWRSWRCYMQSSALAQGQSPSHLWPGQQKPTACGSAWLVLIGMCVFQCFVSVDLVVSQRVEPFPVVVDLSGDVFVLQNDSGHPTLTPFFKQRKQKFRTHGERQKCLRHSKSPAVLILNDLSDSHCRDFVILWCLRVIFIVLLLVFLYTCKRNNFWLHKS